MGNNSLNSISLASLKDVHLPTPVSIFPLAPGWYFVLGMGIIIIGLLIWYKLRKIKRFKQLVNVFDTLNELEHRQLTQPDSPHIIEEVSILLKRVARYKFPEAKPHLLFGDKWLNFLDKTGRTNQFNTSIGNSLANSYMPQPINNPNEFFALIRKWLNRVLK